MLFRWLFGNPEDYEAVRRGPGRWGIEKRTNYGTWFLAFLLFCVAVRYWHFMAAIAGVLLFLAAAPTIFDLLSLLFGGKSR